MLPMSAPGTKRTDVRLMSLMSEERTLISRDYLMSIGRYHFPRCKDVLGLLLIHGRFHEIMLHEAHNNCVWSVF